MKLSKPGDLGGSSPVQSGIIESGFAAYAQCSPDMQPFHQTATAHNTATAILVTASPSSRHSASLSGLQSFPYYTDSLLAGARAFRCRRRPRLAIADSRRIYSARRVHTTSTAIRLAHRTHQPAERSYTPLTQRRQLANKRMKLTKRSALGGSWPRRAGVMESRFAAYPPCSAPTGVSGA